MVINIMDFGNKIKRMGGEDMSQERNRKCIRERG
jgi:hypothetical protein